jgi:hypothetical protein
MKTKVQLLIVALGLSAWNIPSANADGHGNPNPGILPPNAVFNGKTMGEWNAAWWYWVLTAPVNSIGDPLQLDDGTGEYAHINNNGADGLFFLAKSWAGVPQTRTVTVPAGTVLYIPVMGLGLFGDEALWSSFFPTLQETMDWMNTFIPDMTDLSVSIDGQPVADLEDGNHYYLNNTGLTSLFNPDGSVRFELGYGYEISFISTPLTPGQHVIEMHGSGAFGFRTDVTYHLTVQTDRK